MIIRPRAVIASGEWREGLELEFVDGRIAGIRASSQPPDPVVLSAPFVNAHSHFEYRGLVGLLDDEPDFFSWIRKLTEVKASQTGEAVRRDCAIAADENVRSGVAMVAEHSDRPGSGEAMAAAGLAGVLFHEVITFRERDAPEQKLAIVKARVEEARQRYPDIASFANPHSLYTVDESTLRYLFAQSCPHSIHVAESIHENDLIERAEGPFADLERRFGFEPRPRGMRTIAYLKEVGGLRSSTQIVHACDINSAEIEQISDAGASVAHCPRSNVRLQSPAAPIREMLDAGIRVGLGLDSAASSGPIDVFAEMRAARQVAEARGQPLAAAEIWRMATDGGGQSLGMKSTQPEAGSEGPFLLIEARDATSLADLIDSAQPQCVSWLGKATTKT